MLRAGWPRSLVSIPGVSKSFSLLYNVLISSGTYPTFYIMVYRGAFPEIKRLEREAIQSPPSSVEVENGGVIPPLRNTSLWQGA
jgi:hypothetical protein